MISNSIIYLKIIKSHKSRFYLNKISYYDCYHLKKNHFPTKSFVIFHILFPLFSKRKMKDYIMSKIKLGH